MASAGFVRVTSFSLALVAGFLAGCSGGSSRPPASDGARPSGQSRLIEKTFAGKDRCDASQHTRPFVVEWDATDMSSFESRATTDVVFVRYEGCNLEVVDTCTSDSVRGALGAYGPVDWTSGSVEKVDILDENELYAKLPLGAATIGGRVRSGERFHMEYFVSGTRKATRSAVFRSELDRVPGCRGVTHYVYAYNVGAFALGSLTNLHASAGATLWGIGAGANHANRSAIEKQAGVLGSCRGESATEVSTCKVPIRLTLRPIEAGEPAEAREALAPETPEAMNLAGKLAASGERSREANERMQSATRKLAARDGKGCLAELDAFDRLDARPGSLSTEPKGLGSTRAVCLMLSGQCSAGRDLFRRSRQAQAPGDSASDIDRTVDSHVATYCGTGAKKPRDRLLVALSTLDKGSRERAPAARCSEAVDTALATLGSVTPRDESDATVRNAPRVLVDNGSKCLARAGECIQAWRRFPTLVAAREKGENIRIARDVKRLRDAFEHATYGECVGKDPGTLSPVEDFARSVVELDWATGHDFPATPAICNDLIARGKRALPTVLADRASSLGGAPARALREHGAKCLKKAGDCAGAQAFYVEDHHAENPDKPWMDSERSYAREVSWGPCMTHLTSGLPPERALAQALRVIDEARKQKQACGPAWEALKASVPAVRASAVFKEYEDELSRDPLRCFSERGLCNEAWAVHKTVNAWRAKPADERALRDRFLDGAEACRDTTSPGLATSEQFWAAFVLMDDTKGPSVRERCLDLERVAVRTSPAVKLRSDTTADSIDVALAHCLVRAKDCEGARQALLRTPWAKDTPWVSSHLRECRK